MNKVGKNIKLLPFLLLMIFCIFLADTDSSDSRVCVHREVAIADNVSLGNSENLLSNDAQNTDWITNPDASGRKEKAVLVNNRRIRCVFTYTGKQNKIRVRVLFWLLLTVYEWKDSRFSYYVLKSTLEKCRKSKCRVCVRRGPPVSDSFVQRNYLHI